MKYLITIAKPQKKHYVSSRALEKVMAYLWLDHHIDLKYGKWERHGMYKQLHYHGIFELPPGTRYTHLTKLGIYHLRFDKIEHKNDIPRIKRYIDKHYHPSLHTQHDTQMANFFNNSYGF